MLNVYVFETLETTKCVMAENITDALRRAEQLISKTPYTINQVYTVASDVVIAPEVLRKLSTLELQTGD